MFSELERVLFPATLSFLIGIAMTPALSYYLYEYKAWKKTPGKNGLDGKSADEFNRLHSVNETRAPRMGGVIVWGSVTITTIVIAALAFFIQSPGLTSLNFLSRNETWIPFAALLIGAFVGLIDDLLVIRPEGKGIQLRYRLLIVFLLSFFIGWWFWAKLGVSTVNIPFAAPLQLGWGTVPLFMFISLCLYASGVIDGIDGLSGGVFASIFAAYAIVAYAYGQGRPCGILRSDGRRTSRIPVVQHPACPLLYERYRHHGAHFGAWLDSVHDGSIGSRGRRCDTTDNRRSSCRHRALRCTTDRLETSLSSQAASYRALAPSFRSDRLARLQSSHALLGALDSARLRRRSYRDTRQKLVVKKTRVDKVLVFLLALLLVGGCLIFASAAFGLLARGQSNISSVVFNHLVLGVGAGLVALVILASIDYRWWRKMAPYVYGIFGVADGACLRATHRRDASGRPQMDRHRSCFAATLRGDEDRPRS